METNRDYSSTRQRTSTTLKSCLDIKRGPNDGKDSRHDNSANTRLTSVECTVVVVDEVRLRCVLC